MIPYVLKTPSKLTARIIRLGAICNELRVLLQNVHSLLETVLVFASPGSAKYVAHSTLPACDGPTRKLKTNLEKTIIEQMLKLSPSGSSFSFLKKKKRFYAEKTIKTRVYKLKQIRYGRVESG